MPTPNQILLRLELDPSGAIRGVSEFVNESVKGNQKLQQETGKLSGFIKEQRAENRKENFLINESRQAIGSLSFAITAFGVAGDGAMKKVTDGVGKGLIAFQGFDFALAALGVSGPMGLAIAGIAALTTVLVPMIFQSEESTKTLKTQREAVDELAGAYDDLTGKLKGSDAVNKANAAINAAELKRQAEDYRAFLDEVKNGVKQETTVLGQRVEMTVTGEKAMELARQRHSQAYAIYEAARLKAGRGSDAEAVGLKEVQSELDAIQTKYEANIAVINEVVTTGIDKSKADKELIETEAQLISQLTVLDAALQQVNLTDYNRNRLLEERAAINKKLFQDTEKSGFVGPKAVSDPLLPHLGKEFLVDLERIPDASKFAADRLEADAQRTSEVYSILGNSISTSMQAMFAGNEAGFGGFLKSILNGFINLAEGMILTAQAAAAAKGVFTFGTSLISDLAIIGGAFVVLEGARGLINSFARGGQVNKPTFALIGDGDGPEIVAPRRTFEDIMHEEIIPRIIQTVKILTPQEPSPAYALVGGSSGSDRVIGELRDLNRVMRGKNFSPRITGLVNGQTLVMKNLPTAGRRLKEIQR